MYLSVLIGRVIIFQMSFSASRGPCICYFSTDDTILVFIAEFLVMYTSSKKNYIISEPELKIIWPPHGCLVQAYCILDNFCFYCFSCFFAPVFSVMKTKTKYSVLFGTQIG